MTFSNLTFAFVLASLTSSWAVAAIPASERTVLVSFYNSTNGPGWKNKTNWLGVAGSECDWYGVLCSGDHVLVLQMDRNNVTGSLPSLAGLTNLQALSLQNNLLTGAIPPLEGLTNLKTVALSHNQLSGSLPSLTGLTQLTSLDLIFNQLTGPLPSFTGLTNLTILHLDVNRFTGSIPPLTGLTKLYMFAIGGSQLTGQIPSLAGLTNLREVNLGGNQLTGPIPPLTGLTNLTTVYLNNNQLTGLIPSLTGLTSLQSLQLFGNQLSGSIPSLAGLASLQDLNLSHNQLSGTVPPQTALPSLAYIWLNNNQLSGAFPALTELTSLVQVVARYNNFTGPIPGFNDLQNLRGLYFENNQMSGSIPQLSGLPSLQVLHFDGNQLTGSIPALTGLPELISLYLDGNKLSGPLPAAPPKMSAGNSALCPNNLTPSVDAAWDTATGVTPWSKYCSSPAPPPVITSVASLNATASVIQAGSWISISGTNLAVFTDFWNGDVSTILGRTTVTINGKTAFLSYVSPIFMNVQAPDDVALGPVEVNVSSGWGVGTSTVTLAQVAPSFNLLDTKHVAAIILRSDGSGLEGGGTYDIAGPGGTALAYKTVPAAAGNTVVLFGVGFGPTNPTVPAGTRFVGAARAALPIQFLINGKTITPDWAGISAPGQFQFNITLPPGLGTGDVPIQALVDGVSSPTGMVLSLR